MDNPNSSFSRIYHLKANVLQSKEEVFSALGSYQCNMHLADCYTQFGAGFRFQPLIKQYAVPAG